MAGLAASSMIQSPQQAVADARGPGPTVLTAEVEHRTLTDTVIIRGSVAGSRTVEVQPATVEGRTPIVTAVRIKVGASVAAGDVVMEVSGRPIIALPGVKPAYRDLLPGSKGEDVRQLQAALRSLGYKPGKLDGVFGPGTKNALADFYVDLGFEATTTSTTDESAIAAAEDAVVQADRAVEDARDVRARAKQAAVGTTSKALARAEEDALRARRHLAELERVSGTMLPLSEVVFLPAFPARVEKLSAQVGATIKEAPLVLSSGDLVVNASVNAVQRQRLKVGMPTKIDSEASEGTNSGKISAIGELSASSPDGGFSHPVTIKPDEPLPSNLSGQEVRLSIETATTGDRVLVVPQSAVFSVINGSSAVLRQDAHGPLTKIIVSVDASGDGYTAVTPANEGHLKPGDRVLVGDTSLFPDLQ
ncbi:peptidoglycan-binding protein [Plantactinospora sp. KLBMP9567]|uniref:peptidoglycan-binding protein n=1 Tax=Plantactinospora sp. KLBMP9567 TaxID=3085900 RepID=UPI002980C256|nr:peptidoglycan-binding protein [Plantactinospora sp. KLBMP9567]MDW5327202.1 peptidoglycan-binding protein [Plantactinospora sp. KLBMP9567]